MERNKIYHGNCLDRLAGLDAESVDLVYLDPPFFTQKKHRLSTRDESNEFTFDDTWKSLDEYVSLIESCLQECRRVLKPTGSIFLHCDKTASHHLRVSLDKVFGTKNFQSEIIWTYKRWSNAKKGLLNSHQTIYFYSRTKDFKFNRQFTDYAATTNLDQILQAREKTSSGKSVYKTDENGNVVLGKEKKGVPLSDTWEIPYLNPKAKERVGYPTQKPVLLLQQIIKIATDENDLVVDPFCGSGSTCVAAKSLNREFIGIDISAEAIVLARRRLSEMVITESRLLKKGAQSYLGKSEEELAILKSIEAFPVQRNSGIDGFLKSHYEGKPVPVKIQGKQESLLEASKKLERASNGKGYLLKIVVQTRPDVTPGNLFQLSSNVSIVLSPQLQVAEMKRKLRITKEG